MKTALLAAALGAFAFSPVPAAPPKASRTPPKSEAKKPADPAADDRATHFFDPTESRSAGSVTIAGQPVPFDAVAGTLVVHARDWSDTDILEAKAEPKDDKSKSGPKPEASMFYTAYFRQGVPAAGRPIMFLFNGGPGSSTVWLRMGAFGPVRVVTADERHTPAPYPLINNDQSLLDVTDLVFIDAPGTGFSRIAGKDKEKSFYGVDQDIDAFTKFIAQFLSKYHRWQSPKFVFGESYGTMRGAGLARSLQEKDIDLNGLILLSDILNWDFMPDDPETNPGIDMPYIVALPTYAATAWYHGKVAGKPPLDTFLREVENFATGDFASALMKGNTLSPEEKQRIAARLSGYTGLSTDYLLKTNLRIEYGAFQKELLGDKALSTGTLDTRFTGSTIDRLSKVVGFDPQSSAISAAYLAAWNDYVRQTLHYGEGIEYKSGIPIYSKWDYRHAPPGSGTPLIALPNVLPDLAVAMKQNPDLEVMVNGGYFDVSTPYFEGVMEMRHLPVPPELQRNIEYHYYPSGHMVYVRPEDLKAIRDNVASFIARSTTGR